MLPRGNGKAEPEGAEARDDDHEGGAECGRRLCDDGALHGERSAGQAKAEAEAEAEARAIRAMARGLVTA